MTYPLGRRILTKPSQIAEYASVWDQSHIERGGHCNLESRHIGGVGVGDDAGDGV